MTHEVDILGRAPLMRGEVESQAFVPPDRSDAWKGEHLLFVPYKTCSFVPTSGVGSYRMTQTRRQKKVSMLQRLKCTPEQIAEKLNIDLYVVKADLAKMATTNE
tara:strand:+ start:12732 stop:13043 length:312 start_codon:yes stop_codon:yes gene_type:complete